MAENRKVAFITGGRRGIGFGVAKALAAQGLDIAINGVSPAAGSADAIAELEDLGAEVLYVQGDVADLAGHAAMIEAVGSRFGVSTCWSTTPASGPRSRDDILTATPENFDHVMRTNLRGPYF